MTSIYLVRRGEVWLTHGVIDWKFTEDVCAAEKFCCRESAEEAAKENGAEPVEFREVCGDTEAGALSAAEATIARLREELGQLRDRPRTHEAAKKFLEATDGRRADNP